MPGVSSTLPLPPGTADAVPTVVAGQRPVAGPLEWRQPLAGSTGATGVQSSRPELDRDRLSRGVQPDAGSVAQSPGLVRLAWIAALLVALPVFVQAPWVRDAPVGATLFTVPLLAAGVLLQNRGTGFWRPLGSLLVGFAGSWLGGSIFWGWFRDQPLWHLPMEAFALPLALGGWRTRWRLACGFYLGALAGTACTDLVIALTGVIRLWPAVVNGSLDQAPLLLHEACLSLLHPLPIGLILTAAILLTLTGRWLWRRGETERIAAAALLTTLAVDGLFLVMALMAPRLSGLI